MRSSSSSSSDEPPRHTMSGRTTSISGGTAHIMIGPYRTPVHAANALGGRHSRRGRTTRNHALEHRLDFDPGRATRSRPEFSERQLHAVPRCSPAATHSRLHARDALSQAVAPPMSWQRRRVPTEYADRRSCFITLEEEDLGPVTSSSSSSSRQPLRKTSPSGGRLHAAGRRAEPEKLHSARRRREGGGSEGLD